MSSDGYLPIKTRNYEINIYTSELHNKYVNKVKANY